MKAFFKAFKRASVFGLRVELLNEQTLEPEILTFTPTLSSLILSYVKPMLDGAGEPVNRVLDFEKAGKKSSGAHDSDKQVQSIEGAPKSSSGNGPSEVSEKEPAQVSGQSQSASSKAKSL